MCDKDPGSNPGYAVGMLKEAIRRDVPPFFRFTVQEVANGYVIVGNLDGPNFISETRIASSWNEVLVQINQLGNILYNKSKYKHQELKTPAVYSDQPKYDPDEIPF